MTVESNTKYRPVLFLAAQTEAGNLPEFRSTSFQRILKCTRGGLHAVRRENLPLNYWESVYVCSAHFQDSDFERDTLAELMNVQRTRKLKIGAYTYCLPPQAASSKRKIKTQLEYLAMWRYITQDKATI